jgi:hypothetical protein
MNHVEFLTIRERLFDDVLKAEPGEERLKAFAKIAAEDRNRDRSEKMESEVSLELCFLLTSDRMAREIIELRADREAVRKRYAEIENFYGPRMLCAVQKMVGWCSPPLCCVCNSEEDRGPDDPFESYSVDSWGPDWMHKSCMEKFLSWADDDQMSPEHKSGPQFIPEMKVLDEAWRRHNDAVEDKR